MNRHLMGIGMPGSGTLHLLAMADIGELGLKPLQAVKLALVQEVHQHEQLSDVILQGCARQQQLVPGRNVLQRLSHTATSDCHCANPFEYR